MLKQRLLTILIALPLVLSLIIFTTPGIYMILTWVVMLLAAFEWMALIDLHHLALRILYIIALTAGFVLCLLADAATRYFIFELTALWWLIALLLISRYPKSQNLWARSWILPLLGVMVLVPFAFALIHLRGQNSVHAVLYVMFLVWVADSGAYIVGKRFGRHKLLPAVSPGKTLEGAMGGFIATMIVAALPLLNGPEFSIDIVGFQIDPVSWLLIAASTFFISIVGDLTESMIKRHKGVKDSSHLLPGHGGILDRIDSLTAALPWFALMLFVVRFGIQP